ncbi:hypothetical protein [Paenibacillus sp. MABNR03]|uniref:hypothetical protein n=1 Tax=Paenibacillus sp. MABNR03 TaxID=3142626 RepID=UPI003D27913B
MIPILVTPMSRVDAAAKSRHIYTNSFNNRKFPQVMREMAAKLGVTLIDLNKESLRYYNEIGVEATTAIFMSIEEGETPAAKVLYYMWVLAHPINMENDISCLKTLKS